MMPAAKKYTPSTGTTYPSMTWLHLLVVSMEVTGIGMFVLGVTGPKLVLLPTENAIFSAAVVFLRSKSPCPIPTANLLLQFHDLLLIQREFVSYIWQLFSECRVFNCKFLSQSCAVSFKCLHHINQISHQRHFLAPATDQLILSAHSRVRDRIRGSSLFWW